MKSTEWLISCSKIKTENWGCKTIELILKNEMREERQRAKKLKRVERRCVYFNFVGEHNIYVCLKLPPKKTLLFFWNGQLRILWCIQIIGKIDCYWPNHYFNLWLLLHTPLFSPLSCSFRINISFDIWSINIARSLTWCDYVQCYEHCVIFGQNWARKFWN